MTKYFLKITAVKLFYTVFFGSKIAIHLSLGLHEGHTSYRRSLQPSKVNIKHIKTWTFFIFFYVWGSLSSWIRIRIRKAEPDPATKINADPDPQPWREDRDARKNESFFFIQYRKLPTLIQGAAPFRMSHHISIEAKRKIRSKMA